MGLAMSSNINASDCESSVDPNLNERSKMPLDHDSKSEANDGEASNIQPNVEINCEHSVEATTSVKHGSEDLQDSSSYTEDMVLETSSPEANFWSRCHKNPGHAGFIPVTEFRPDCLPSEYRKSKYCDYIELMCALTVKLRIRHTSCSRPPPDPVAELENLGGIYRTCTGFLSYFNMPEWVSKFETSCYWQQNSVLDDGLQAKSDALSVDRFNLEKIKEYVQREIRQLGVSSMDEISIEELGCLCLQIWNTVCVCRKEDRVEVFKERIVELVARTLIGDESIDESADIPQEMLEDMLASAVRDGGDINLRKIIEQDVEQQVVEQQDVKQQVVEQQDVEQQVVEQQDVEQQMVEQQDVEQQDSEQQVVELQGVEQQDVEQQVVAQQNAKQQLVVQHDIELQNVELQDVEQQVVDKPDVEHQDLERQDVEQQDVEQQVVDKPDVEHQDTEQDAAQHVEEQQDAEKQDVEQQDVEQQDVEQQDVEQQDVEQQDVEQQDVEQQDVEQQDVEHQDTEQDAAQQVEEQQDAEQQDIEQQDAAQQVEEQQDAEKQDVEQQDVEQQDVEQQDVEQQDVEQQDVEQQDVEQQDVEQQVVELQGVEQQDVEQQLVVQHDIELQNVELQDVEQQVVDKPDVEHQDLERQDVEQQDVEQQVVDKPDVEHQDTEQDAAQQVEEQQDAEKQDVEQQDVEQQDVEQQDVEQQDVEQQDVEQQDVEQQDVEQQDVEHQDTEQDAAQQVEEQQDAEHQDTEQDAAQQVEEQQDAEKQDVEQQDVEQQDVEQQDVEQQDVEQQDVEQQVVVQHYIELQDVEQQDVEQQVVERQVVEQYDADLKDVRYKQSHSNVTSFYLKTNKSVDATTETPVNPSSNTSGDTVADTLVNPTNNLSVNTTIEKLINSTNNSSYLLTIANSENAENNKSHDGANVTFADSVNNKPGYAISRCSVNDNWNIPTNLTSESLGSDYSFNENDDDLTDDEIRMDYMCDDLTEDERPVESLFDGKSNISNKGQDLEYESPCKCTECKKSDRSKMTGYVIRVVTDRRVIFDDDEAMSTIVDVEFGSETKHFYGQAVEGISDNSDLVYLVCTTHEISVAEKIIDMCRRFDRIHKQLRSSPATLHNGKNPIAVVCSYPHGYTKVISIGQWTDRYLHECGQSSPLSYVSYEHTSPTCPGSAGAPVLVLGQKQNTRQIHNEIQFHYGSLSPQLNKTAIGFGLDYNQ